MWVAKIKFSRWVGPGLKPFDTFGRLLHVEPLYWVRWDAEWLRAAVSASIGRDSASEELIKSEWLGVVLGWSGTIVRCVTLCGQHLSFFHADDEAFSEIEDIRVEPGQFLLANLEFIQ